jgi:small subunit ribosomal protein S16
VATKIRLMRLGKIRAPYYRIVVADSRTKRDGRVIETIGKYHPKEDPSFIEVDSDRALYWLGVGAQPTEPVAAILKVTGDWQKFKGLPAPEQGLKTAAAKPDRKAIFEAAAKETVEDAPKPAKKAPAKKAAAAEEAPAAEAPADAPAAEEAPAAEAPADAPAAEEAPAAEAPAADAPAAEAPAPDDQPAGTDDAPAPVEEAADAAATPDADARPETSGNEPVQTANDTAES